MGERTEYELGTFCWADLATVDSAGAKAFYGALLGLEAVDLPAGPAGTYTMLRLGGRDVCALSERGADQGPPAWLSYVSVADVEEAAARARKAGGTVVADPFDVDAHARGSLQQVTGFDGDRVEPGKGPAGGVGEPAHAGGGGVQSARHAGHQSPQGRARSVREGDRGGPQQSNDLTLTARLDGCGQGLRCLLGQRVLLPEPGQLLSDLRGLRVGGGGRRLKAVAT